MKGEDILSSRSIPYPPLTPGSLSILAPTLGEPGADVQEIVDFLTSGNTSGNSIGGAAGDAAESGGDDVVGLGAAALIGMFSAGSSIVGAKMASNTARDSARMQLTANREAAARLREDELFNRQQYAQREKRLMPYRQFSMAALGHMFPGQPQGDVPGMTMPDKQAYDPNFVLRPQPQVDVAVPRSASMGDLQVGPGGYQAPQSTAQPFWKNPYLDTRKGPGLTTPQTSLPPVRRPDPVQTPTVGELLALQSGPSGFAANDPPDYYGGIVGRGRG